MVQLFDGSTDHLARALEYAGRRHEVLTQNIANAETPGYRARDLAVGETFATVIGGAITNEASGGLGLAAAQSEPRLTLVQDNPAAANGNDVNLDRQMARLAENSLFHQALVQILAGQFTVLKQAVSGRV